MAFSSSSSRWYSNTMMLLPLLALLWIAYCGSIPDGYYASSSAPSSSVAAAHTDGEEELVRTCRQTNDDDDDDGNTCTVAAAAATTTTTTTTAAATKPQNTNPQYPVRVINHSVYRADVYWDDGRFGTLLATLDAKGGSTQLNANAGHAFFVTRHGVREGLFDPESDQPYRYVAVAVAVAVAGRPTTDPQQDTQQDTRQRWDIPADAAPSTNPCQDRYSTCHHEMKRGSCHTTPGWMIVNCCKSCDGPLEASKLIDPKVRCSKEHLNMTQPIWKPGDLNALFERWATSDEFAAYSPKVLSSPTGRAAAATATADHVGATTAVQKGPWVMTFDTFLSADEAAALIQGGRMVGFDRSTDQGAISAAGEMEKVVSRTRTSSNAWCTGACEQLPHVQAVSQRIEDVTGIPKSHYESFQILEYTPEQFYRRHHDSSGNKDDTPSGHRILTFFLYLSDVEQGGETYFNQLDLAVKPKLGRALVWPSVLNETPDVWDARMFHEAKDVIEGKKFAANHWIHYNDYVTPNIWGCTGGFM